MVDFSIPVNFINMCYSALTSFSLVLVICLIKTKLFFPTVNIINIKVN